MDTQETPQPTTPPVKKKGRSLGLLFIILGAILLFLAATLFLSQPPATNQPDTPKTTISPSAKPSLKETACGKTTNFACPEGLVCELSGDGNQSSIGKCVPNDFSFTEEEATGESRIKEETVCTLEARLCPDGSSVGRIGPNCEFAACPGE